MRSPSSHVKRPKSGFPMTSDDKNLTLIERVKTSRDDKEGKNKQTAQFMNKEALEDPNLVS